jgi:hypothetical protein
MTLIVAASVTLAACPAAIADNQPLPGSVQTVPPEDAEAILGRSVSRPDGKDIGRLVDVLVDQDG